MVVLNADAQTQLARYLRQMRAALRGHPSVDPDDIERDVLRHIDAELAGHPEPVVASDLRRVLDRLGAPSQWAVSEELTPWWGLDQQSSRRARRLAARLSLADARLHRRRALPRQRVAPAAAAVTSDRRVPDGARDPRTARAPRRAGRRATYLALVGISIAVAAGVIFAIIFSSN